MDAFNKTIKKLSDEEFQQLLAEVSDKKESKPYMVLEAARNHNYDDNTMMELLQVNSSTYYTLKSRLRTKVAGILSKKVDNPISVLMDEVARVPAILYGANKEVAVRALKDLEKQLLEYDLSNELIVVYKTLAKLHLYNYDNEYYNKLHNRYVAYSLAVAKAENLFYDFIRKMGNYQLTRTEQDLESVKIIRRELANIKELYESHRLFVLYNIISIYSLCLLPGDVESMRSKEIEIDNTLREINDIFNKYSLDTFYQNNKLLVDLLYFEYYQRTKNTVRASHYYKRSLENIVDASQKHILTFYVINFLNDKLDLYLSTGDSTILTELNDELENELDIDKEEVYHYAAYRNYQAYVRFYEGDYGKAARIINELRTTLSLRSYTFFDVQSKLFQALQYSIMGDEELSSQITNSVKRQIDVGEEEYANVRAFLKLLQAINKEGDFKKKYNKLTNLWNSFTELNHGRNKILPYLKLNDKLIKKMAEPYKMA